MCSSLAISVPSPLENNKVLLTLGKVFSDHKEKHQSMWRKLTREPLSSEGPRTRMFRLRKDTGGQSGLDTRALGRPSRGVRRASFAPLRPERRQTTACPDGPRHHDQNLLLESWAPQLLSLLQERASLLLRKVVWGWGSRSWGVILPLPPLLQ